MNTRVRVSMSIGAVLLLGSALSGCSSSDDSATSNVSATASAAPSPSSGQGAEWKFIPIQSDTVAEAGYDASTFTLIVKFKKGSVYSYSPVPPTIWQQFQDAQPDPWSKVGKPYLVDGEVPYHQLQ